MSQKIIFIFVMCIAQLGWSATESKDERISFSVKRQERLFLAIEENNLDKVRNALDKNPELINAAHVETYHKSVGFTPLLFAAEKGHGDIVVELLRRNASIEAVTPMNETLLHSIAAQPYIGISMDIIQDIIRKGADINARDSLGCTVLHRAVKCANEPMCKLLLDYGAEINTFDIWRNTPLMHAIVEGTSMRERYEADRAAPQVAIAYNAKSLNRATYTRIALALLDKGANVYVTCEGGYTPLSAADALEIGDIRAHLKGII